MFIELKNQLELAHHVLIFDNPLEGGHLYLKKHRYLHLMKPAFISLWGASIYKGYIICTILYIELDFRWSFISLVFKKPSFMLVVVWFHVFTLIWRNSWKWSLSIPLQCFEENARKSTFLKNPIKLQKCAQHHMKNAFKQF